MRKNKPSAFRVDNTKNVETLNFASVNIPQPVQDLSRNKDTFVSYGVDNLYPDKIDYWFNNCSIHKAIQLAKAAYIKGAGLKYVKGEKVKAYVNAEDTIDSFVKKIVRDYVKYGYFLVEVTFLPDMSPAEYIHVPAKNVRWDESRSKFWVNKTWATKSKADYIIDRWKPGEEDGLTKMFLFAPSSDGLVYPLPDYSSTIASIQTDIEIKKFNLNNIKNHFSVSTLITFFMGTSVSDEVKKQVLKEINASYTGANGKKIIIDFQSPDGKSAEVQNISPNDWDKAYTLIADAIVADIVAGNGVVSPALFGIQTEGKLGASNELKNAYTILKKTTMADQRAELESALNRMFEGFSEIKGEVEFMDEVLFDELSETARLKVSTYNEVRAALNMEPIEGGDRLIEDKPAQPAQVETSKFSNDKGVLYEPTKEQVAKLLELNLGAVREQFDFCDEGEFVSNREEFRNAMLKFETNEEIVQYIIDNQINGLTVKDLKTKIRKDLGYNLTDAEVREHIQKITSSGLQTIDETDGKLTVKPTQKPIEESKLEVMYAYEERPGIPAGRSREFCNTIIKNNRLYTREEIQSISQLFEYDVFTYGGGFYHNPVTGETTPYCRHTWKMYTVKRKRK